jgi:hypothetical protein
MYRSLWKSNAKSALVRLKVTLWHRQPIDAYGQISQPLVCLAIFYNTVKKLELDKRIL